MAYLDYSGLQHYDKKIKQKVTDEFVGKVAGKGLSTNDLTDELLNKLNGVEAGAQKNVQADWNETDEASNAFIKNKPKSLDGGDAATVNGHTVEADVPADAKFTDTTYEPMVGATADAAGKAGLVPAAAAGDQEKFLRADGSFAVPENTTYGNADGETAGLVKGGGDVSIADGVITVVNYTHTHNKDDIADLGSLDFAPTVHTHTTTDITGLDSEYAKFDHTHPEYASNDHRHDDLYAPSMHTHTSDQVGIDTSMFAPASHSHDVGDISGAVAEYTKGMANGVASLDDSGKVPASQLPSYVDDVVEGYISGDNFYEDSSFNTQIDAESGKIYVDIASGKVYRWSGSVFAEISASLTLGTTANTAFAGDKGQAAYEHSQKAHAPADAQKNVIEVVKVNGTPVDISSDKSINIDINGIISGEITAITTDEIDALFA